MPMFYFPSYVVILSFKPTRCYLWSWHNSIRDNSLCSL